MFRKRAGTNRPGQDASQVEDAEARERPVAPLPSAAMIRPRVPLWRNR